MNKAFLFDMDGVLVDSESHWFTFEEPFYRKIFGDEVFERLKFGPGIGIDGVYEAAIAAGAVFDKNEFHKGFEEVAMSVYDVSSLTQGTEKLVKLLQEKNFKIGVVTNSPQTWVDRVVPRLPFSTELDLVFSIKEHSELKPKPYPDGFLEALRVLGASPRESIVLEDSNPGIAAAKAAGCFTIGFSGNLVSGYKQTGADTYADTMEEVADIVIRQSQT